MSQGRYPVPFVRHSVAQQQPPTQGVQPPVVVDVQRLVEHLKADFRAELQVFKTELVAAIRQEFLASKPAVVNVSSDPEEIAKVVRRALEQQGGRAAPAQAPMQEEDSPPIFMPSDLLAPREGTVAVKTSEEGSGALDAAAATLRKLKGRKT